MYTDNVMAEQFSQKSLLRLLIKMHFVDFCSILEASKKRSIQIF